MMTFTVFDESGRIIRSGICQDDTFSDQVNPGENIIEDMPNGKGYWVDGGSLAKRPVLPPWPNQMQAPATLDMGALPAGSVVIARPNSGPEVSADNPAKPIVLAGSGVRYRVTVTPPWLRMSHEQTIDMV